MSGCNHDCGSCSQKCSEQDLHKPLNQYSAIKKVVAVSSGKGGVGKSSVTSMLAVMMARRGYKVGVLDADITGPSAPTAFGVTECQGANEDGLYPALTKGGIQVMSINLLLDNATDPVVWRGPVIAGAVKQFWTDVIWEDVDYLFVDMPPGTGDVPLTVFQSLPVDGIIIVTSPQDLVSMIVAKAVKMAQMMHIPVLGFVENYSYLQCPDCGKKINVFGESHIAEIANQFGYELLAQSPMDAKLAALVDKGWIEMMQNDYLDTATQVLKYLYQFSGAMLVVIKILKHDIFKRKSTLTGPIILLKQSQYLCMRIWFLHRHQLLPFVAKGDMKAYRQMAFCFLHKVAYHRYHTNGGNRYTPRTHSHTPFRCKHLNAFEHSVEVVERFSHSHIHNIGKRRTFGYAENLIQYLSGGKVAFKSLLAGNAKLTAHLATYLRRYAKGGTLFVGYIYAFDIFIFAYCKKVFLGTINRGLAIYRQ